MVYPVARLALDSRSWGPAYCERCETDVEDVILMSDASMVCPECGTPVKDLKEFYDTFVSAVPLKKEWRPTKKGK